MSATAAVNITGKENVSELIEKVMGKLGAMPASVAKVATAFVAFEAVKGVLESVGRAVGECVESFAEQERASVAFGAAMNQASQLSKSAADRLADFADSMALLTGEEESTIKGLETFLATSGRTEEQIMRIIDVAADMSVATGQDLDGAVRQLNKTFGGLAGELGETMPAIKGLTAEELKAGEAVEVLSRQYDGLAEAMGGTLSTNMANLKNTWTEFKAAIGENLAPIFTPMLGWIQSIVDKWTSSLTEYKKYRDAMKKDAAARTIEDELTIARHQKAENEKAIASALAGKFAPNAPRGPGSMYASALSMQRQGYGMDELELKIMDLEAKLIAAQAEADAATGGGGGGGGKDTPYINPYASGVAVRPNDLLLANIIAAGGDDLGYYNPGSREHAGGMRGAQPDRSRDDGALFGGEEIVGSAKPMHDPLGSFGRGAMANVSGTEAGQVASGGLGGLLGVFEQVAGTFGGMLTSLAPIQQILNPLGTILQGMFEVIGPLITQALAPLVGILKIVGRIFGQILAPVITFLGDVIKKVAEGLIWVINGVIDAINWALGWLGVSVSRVSLDDAMSAGGGGATTSGGGGSASYDKPRDIRITNHIYTPALVGEGGFREFCLLVGRELKSAGVLGAT